MSGRFPACVCDRVRVHGEPALVIVSGLPGSGKTTLAKQIAQERPGVRLCPDEWMAALGSDIWDGSFRDRVEQFQLVLARDLLRCGTTAIVEWGTWAEEEREQLRDEAASAGARTELVVLDPPLETLWRRVTERGLEDPPMTREYLEGAFAFFQRPDEAEAARYDVFIRIEE